VDNTDPILSSPHLYEMNPLERFSDRAADYARYRPSYPPAAIAAMLANLGEPTQLIAADVGAGTGIGSRLLAEKGVTVWAIEPNAAMRQAGAPHPRVTYCIGSAEQTGLGDRSVHLVTCLQSFHWFDPIPTLQEFHRLLQPGGRLALVWNERERTDAFTTAYGQLIRTASGDHPAENRLQSTRPMAVLTASSLFHQARQQLFPYCQSLDLVGLLGRTSSTSYLPREGTAYEQLLTGLQQLYDQWHDDAGLVHLIYSTNLFLAEASLL